MRILKEQAKRIGAEGVKVADTHLRSGNPDKEILKALRSRHRLTPLLTHQARNTQKRSATGSKRIALGKRFLQHTATLVNRCWRIVAPCRGDWVLPCAKVWPVKRTIHRTPPEIAATPPQRIRFEVATTLPFMSLRR